MEAPTSLTAYGPSSIVRAMSRAQEQRASVRRQTAFAGPDGLTPLRCWLIDATAERFASLADLSRDGARVLTSMPPSVGEKVELRVDMLQRPFVMTGRVVWRSEGFHGRGGVMGLAFDSVCTAPVLEHVSDGALRAT